MRTLIASFVLSLVLFTGFELAAPDNAKADCQHYFERIVIGTQAYMVEYNCDGMVVNMLPIED